MAAALQLKRSRYRAPALVLLLFLTSLALRGYYLHLWGHVPTSDPYHFIGWAQGISQTARLDFPGSEDGAYGQYPDGYPMMLHMIKSVSGVSLYQLTQYLPVLLGSLCVFPVFLIFRRISTSEVLCATGTAIVVFSLAFIKYTSVSIPNLPGLLLFTMAFWLVLSARRDNRRLLAILLVITAAVAVLHYLSLVCVGVLITIVLSRRLMIAASGGSGPLDYRRLAFLLVVALVAGVVAWTAAYRLMLGVYGIDVTRQPPPRLSTSLRLIGYPLIFGVIQTIALPIGIVALLKNYIDSSFRSRTSRGGMDPVLLVAIWLVFLIFALGFLNVEYYPFRFNTFLMIPLGMISLFGLALLLKLFEARRWTSTLGRVLLPATVLVVLLQPLVVSKVSMGGDEPFLPWKQEYGETELVAMSSFLQDEILCTTEVRTSGLPRRQMVMADWVRSRAMKAYGSDFVHLHWWFFQGYSDLEGKPFAFRSLDIYAGEIEKSLEILGRLNLRLASGSTGEWVYYYKYLVTSDWISEIIKDDFGREAEFEKFRAYNGHLLYRHDQNDIQGDDDRVLIREEAGKPGLGQLDYVLRPLDKLYACPGVELFYFTPLGTG